MFHQGVARRGERLLDPRLKQRTRRVKLFMAFNHSLPAAQGPAVTRTGLVSLEHGFLRERQACGGCSIQCAWGRASLDAGHRASCDRSPEPPPFSPLIVTLVSIALVVGARLAGLQSGVIFNTSKSNAEDRLTARQREERPARHSTLDCRASGAAQRRVWTTPRCASPATTLSSFSWSGTNRVQPGTEAARFTSFHLS